MIPGVHARTIALIDFKQAASLFQGSGWIWLGRDGQLSTRHLTLSGTPPRDCRLRVTRIDRLNQAVTATVQLEPRDGVPGTPIIRGEVNLAPAPDGNAATRGVVGLHGLAARNLAEGAGPASAEATRRLANEYARSLLEQIAESLERACGPARSA